MKILLSFLFCAALFFSANGQKSYADAIKQGDDALKKADYKTAISKYFTAEAFDPSKKNIVRDSVNRVFNALISELAKCREALKQKPRG